MEPVEYCGRFCMDSDSSHDNKSDPCMNHTIGETNYTRTVSYTSPDVGSCDSRNVLPGWYRYNGSANVLTTPPKRGQCGSMNPIWFKGSYPPNVNEYGTMRACIVGDYNDCQYGWNVTVKKCQNFNVFYMEPVEYCGRFCMDSNSSHDNKSDPCMNHTIGETNYTRTVSYTSSDVGSCDSRNVLPGWYRYNGSANVLTTPPKRGQCGSMNPIWFKGSYPPNVNEYGTMRACIVGDYNDCQYGWNVTVKKCQNFNVFYMEPVEYCGRFCMDSDSSHDNKSDPCMNHTIGETNYTRTVSYTSSDIGSCDSRNVLPGWYRYNGSANVLTTPPKRGQCGSMNPIWFKGSYPSNVNEYGTMRACIVGDYNDCQYGWNVTVKKCQNFNVFYMEPVEYCGRFCMEMESATGSQQQNDSYVDPCLNHTLIKYNFTRSVDFMLSTNDIGKCDTFDGWYRYESNLTIPNSPPKPGQCGTWNPIWFKQSFNFKDNAEYFIMKACIVSGDDNCSVSWNVTIKTCGTFYVGYLVPLTQCGRYCMENMSSSNVEISTVSGKTNTKIDIEQTTSLIRNLNLKDYIFYVYTYPTVPTYDINSEDRQLMFVCYFYDNSYERAILNKFTFDVKWEIDGELFTVKSNIKYDAILTEGRLKSSEWRSREKKMGINIKCGIRVYESTIKTYVESLSYFAGLGIWPMSLSISSGELATVYVWTTVPITCKYNDTSYPCKLTLDLFDFNQQFTSGAPMYCRNSVTELTKPSMCGLELDGWKQWSWQTLNINLPENSASDQEYLAKVKLQVTQATDDDLWSGYQLPEITVSVVNDNVTEDYWWWYGWCFTGTDPWFFTFDWHWYGFHDQGEFVLYKHKTKPIEVHTIQRRYRHYQTWTEHCAIAVRAASDVFIIYGCEKQGKWIIRRLNCGVGNEYLEVYSRWGGYEIALPTGSRVYVWISMNRRLNAYLTLSRVDRYQTEGLCGTWNRNYDDDYTGRDGKIYCDSTKFARTWRVPASESLFIAKQRTEKLKQSFMYCSCMNSTKEGLSPNVDCSWKETMPVCPPLNWKKESCSIRSKRSADDEDDITIDVPPDIVSFEEGIGGVNDWKNGWNESSAEDACNDYFKKSVLFDACSSLSNVNASSAITNCVLNIKVAGSDDYMADSFELFKTQCTNEVRTNNSLSSNTNGTSIADKVKENDCPYECTYNGTKNGDCVDGFCVCYSYYTGDDCRINMNEPPAVATDINNDSLCNTGSRACNYFSVFGENFYRSNGTKCRIETAQIVDNEIKSTGTYILTDAVMENMGEVRCSMTSSSQRKKRSTVSSFNATVYLVSVTNNGANFSSSVPVILYDSSCTACNTTDSHVFCQLRSDICVVDGVCYEEASSKCITATVDTVTSKLWIIGVVGCSLIFIIILLLLIKWCGTTSNSITPLTEKEAVPQIVYSNIGKSSMSNREKKSGIHKINVKEFNW